MLVADGVQRLGSQAQVKDFISNQYRHGKTILALGASKSLLAQAGIDATLSDDDKDPGILVAAGAKADSTLAGLVAAVGRHRHPEREAAANRAA